MAPLRSYWVLSVVLMVLDRKSSRSVFFLARPLASPASVRGSTLAGDQAVHDRPTGDAVQVRQHRRDLDLGVLEQFFHPLLLVGAVVYRARR